MDNNKGAEIADVLERAAGLVKRGWTHGTGARDDSRSTVLPYSKRAVCWCLEGAIAAITRHDWSSNAYEREPAHQFVANLLRDRGFNGTVYRWNDSPGRTQDEVVALLYEAAALARESSK